MKYLVYYTLHSSKSEIDGQSLRASYHMRSFDVEGVPSPVEEHALINLLT